MGVQWLRLCAPNAGGPGLIPGQGSRSHTLQLGVHMTQPNKYLKKKTLQNKQNVIHLRIFLVAQNPPCNAGDVGLIQHATGQLKPRATTQEPRAATKTAKNKLRKEVIHLDSGRSKLLRAWKSIGISVPMCYIHFLCLRALMCKAEVWFWWRSRDKTPYL